MPSTTKKILLITSGQPSLNPRLVKEADALCDAGYDVTVIYAYWNDWGTALDKDLLITKKWRAIRAGGSPTDDKLRYLLSRLIFKCAKMLNGWFGYKLFADIAVARSTYFLTLEAKKHKADLYIGHNLGALPATVKAAKKHHKPCGFDAEDFHRKEMSDDLTTRTFKIVKSTEDKYIGKLNYLTTSSPLITLQYHHQYPDVSPVTLLNTFPLASGLPYRVVNKGPLKLFWFSQTIGPGRGLEVIAEALRILNDDNFELHLLGDAGNNQNFVQHLSASSKKIFVHGVMPANQIVNFAAQFAIGLAAEHSSPFNRDICLTNKLFTYLQAGLAIAASDTAAQTKFLAENAGIGALYQQTNAHALANILLQWQTDRQLLADNCQTVLNLAQHKYNWEIESQKFLTVVNKTLAG